MMVENKQKENFLLQKKQTISGALNYLTSKSTYAGTLPIDVRKMSRPDTFKAAIVKVHLIFIIELCIESRHKRSDMVGFASI
jgi:hypothetical protein